MVILLYIVFFLFWFIINYRRTGFGASSFVLMSYFIASLFALFVLFATDIYDETRLSLSAIVFHCFCLYFFLYPVIYISNNIGTDFKYPTYTGWMLLNYFIIFISIFTFISLLPKIRDIFSSDDLRLARSLYNHGQLHEEETGVISYLGGVGSTFAYFAFFQFFYCLTRYPQKRVLLIVLFICSFTDALTSLSAVGRGGIMRWVMMALFFYFLFRNDLSITLRKNIKKWGIIASFPGLFVFWLITFSRFTDRDYPVYIYMFDYIGQPFLYFSYIFDTFFEPTFGGRINFPIFFSDDRLAGPLNDEVYTDYNLNTFSTFIGSFYKDIGFYGTLLLSFSFYLLCRFLFELKTRGNSFYKLSIFIFISQVVIHGIFYYQYAGTTKIRGLLLLIFLSIIVQEIYGKKKSLKNNL